MSEYIVTNTELAAVAEAIRIKNNTETDLQWPSGYISAIEAIQGSSSGETIYYNLTVGTITLLAANWTLGTNEYTQTPTLSDTIDSDAKVDLQPTASIIAQMIEDGTYILYAVNTNGTVVIHAIGNAPTEDLTIQYTILNQLTEADGVDF